MQSNVRKLTEGALMVALVGAVLLFDKFTGGLLSSYFSFILPLPLIIYTAKYGIKDAIVPFVAIILLTIMITMITTGFVVINSCVTGIVFGYGINKKKSSGFLFITTFFFTAFSYFITMYLFAGAFGYNFNDDVALVVSVFNKYGNTGNLMNQIPLSLETLIRILLPVTVVLTSVLEAFVVYLLAFFILTRMKFYFPPVKKFSEMRFPKWLGFIMIAICLCTQLDKFVKLDKQITDGFYVLSLVCFIIFMLLGFFVVVWLLNIFGKRNLIFVFYLLLFIFAPVVVPALILLGAFDACTDFRERIGELRKNVR